VRINISFISQYILIDLWIVTKAAIEAANEAADEAADAVMAEYVVFDAPESVPDNKHQNEHNPQTTQPDHVLSLQKHQDADTPMDLENAQEMGGINEPGKMIHDLAPREIVVQQADNEIDTMAMDTAPHDYKDGGAETSQENQDSTDSSDGCDSMVVDPIPGKVNVQEHEEGVVKASDFQMEEEIETDDEEDTSTVGAKRKLLRISNGCYRAKKARPAQPTMDHTSLTSGKGSGTGMVCCLHPVHHMNYFIQLYISGMFRLRLAITKPS
jgi:hypothetical protein